MYLADNKRSTCHMNFVWWSTAPNVVCWSTGPSTGRQMSAQCTDHPYLLKCLVAGSHTDLVAWLVTECRVTNYMTRSSGSGTEVIDAANFHAVNMTGDDALNQLLGD